MRYDYQCPNCEQVFEVRHHAMEEPCILCPDAHCRANNIPEPCDRLISVPNICIPEKHQAAPNLEKIHGTKPLTDIVVPNEQGTGVDVIKGQKTQF